LIALRRAKRADEAGVFALTRAFATTFVPEPGPFAEAFARLMEREDALILVAVRGEDVVGYVFGISHDSLSTNGPIAWVSELMVREDFRRLGVGAALMDAFETWARERGERLVALATRRAAPFYRAIGYEESAVYFRKLLMD
jgi:GNAT superfamily N-acetyltransferase